MESIDSYEEFFRQLDEAGEKLQHQLSALIDIHQQAIEFYEQSAHIPNVDLHELAADIKVSEEFMQRVGPYAALLHRGKRISQENRRRGIH